MALIETITARLTADVGQFQAGFQSATKTVQDFEKVAARSATMFGSGGFLTGSAAAREIMASMARDARNIPPALTAVSTAMTGVGTAAHNAGRLTTTMRMGMQALAAQALGLPGPLGKMASALLVFGTGGVVTTAVLAGLAGIAIGFERAKKKVEEMAAELERVRQLRLGETVAVGRAGPERLQALQELLRSRQQARDSLLEIVRPFQGRPTTGLLAVPPHVLEAYNRIGTLSQLILGTQRQIAEVTRQIAEANVMTLDAVEAQLSIEGQLNEERRLGKLFKQEELAAALALIKIPSIGEELAAKGNKLFKPEDLGLKELSAQMDKMFLQMGLSAMESLARGLLTGAKNVKELLHRFLLDIALFGIFEGIGGAIAKALGIGGESNVQATSNLSAQPMSLQIGTGTLPPPMTPFEASRDAMWQRMLRESVLVAKSQGFR